jgi:hypothetical protein
MTGLGKFGHHPDPTIDAEVECDRLTGLLAEAKIGLNRALDFNAASPAWLAIKRDIRSVLDRLKEAEIENLGKGDAMRGRIDRREP